jgi:hypothetical protein
MHLRWSDASGDDYLYCTGHACINGYHAARDTLLFEHKKHSAVGRERGPVVFEVWFEVISVTVI